MCDYEFIGEIYSNPNMWNSSLICDLFGIWIMKFFGEYEIYKLFQENVGGKIYLTHNNTTHAGHMHWIMHL